MYRGDRALSEETSDEAEHPLTKGFGTTQGRWPQKSIKFILCLLKNAESNVDAKNIVVQQAPKTRRRTYQYHAHGCINPY